MLCFVEQIHQINRCTMLLSRQFQSIITLFYYGMLAVVDGGIFVSTDRKTAPIIRTVAYSTCIFTFSLASFTFILLATLNEIPKRLSPLLRHCCRHPNASARTKIKLVNMDAWLRSGQLGMSPFGIFTFSTGKLCTVLITVVLNFFLFIKLFKSYFFRLVDPAT